MDREERGGGNLAVIRSSGVVPGPSATKPTTLTTVASRGARLQPSFFFFFEGASQTAKKMYQAYNARQNKLRYYIDYCRPMQVCPSGCLYRIDIFSIYF